MSDAQATNGSAKRTILSLVRRAAEIFGIVAGASGGFLTMSFAIGYLAIKANDEMMGLPTTRSAYQEYAATGALFFSRTLRHIVDALGHYVWRPRSLIFVAIVLAVLLLLRSSRGAQMLQGIRRLSRSRSAVSLGFFFCLVLVFAYLPYHVAGLDPGNRELLLFERDTNSHFAARIHELLTGENTVAELNRLYGLQCIVLAVLVYFGFALSRWRASAAAAAVAGTPDRVGLYFHITGSVLRPLLYFLLASIVLSVPINYGILGHSIALPCVVVEVRDASGKERETPSGYLMSDLSHDKNRVVILAWEDNYWTQYFYDREDLAILRVRPCGVANPLHRRPIKRSGAAPIESDGP